MFQWDFSSNSGTKVDILIYLWYDHVHVSRWRQVDWPIVKRSVQTTIVDPLWLFYLWNSATLNPQGRPPSPWKGYSGVIIILGVGGHSRTWKIPDLNQPGDGGVTICSLKTKNIIHPTWFCWIRNLKVKRQELYSNHITVPCKTLESSMTKLNKI